MLPQLRTTLTWLVVAVVLGIAGCGGAETRKAHHLEKGKEYFAAGNFDKARVEFRNALQIAPADSEARFENGLVDEKLGNLREAGQFYQGAVEANPDNVAARGALARLYVFGGAPERALDTVKPGLATHPDDARLLAVRAAAKSQLKDRAGALEDATRAVQLDPLGEDGISVLAGLYRANGDLDKAEALLRDSIVKIPNSLDLRLELGQLYESTGHDQQVEEILADLVKRNPDKSAHRLRLAQYYARMSRLDDAERTLREGVGALPKERDMKIALVDFLSARRSRDAAEQQLRTFIQADPKDYDLRFALGSFYEQGKQSDKAEALYREAIHDAGTDGPGISARNRLAALLVQRNEIAGAEKLIAEVLDKNPRDNDALILRGNLALSQHDPKTAVADLRAVLRDQPNAIGVMRSLARAHLANGEPALAEETMRRAVDANPQDAGARLDLVRLLVQLGKQAQAAPIVAELVKQKPDDLAALETQFKISADLNDRVLAKSDADAIVTLQPKSGLGYYLQGLLADSGKQPDEAIKLYAKSLEVQPASPEPLEALTRVLVLQKRVPEALQRLDQIIATNSKSAGPANLKGEVLLSEHRTAEAEQAFALAAQRDPKWALAYRNLAAAQMVDKNAAGAEATLRQGIQSATAVELLVAGLADLYASLGRIDDAIAVYNAQLKRSPQSEVSSNNLAMLLVTYKKDSASLDRAKELVTHFANSNNADFLDTYGWVLYKRGEGSAAVAALQGVISKTPNSPVSLYHLGMAEVMLGQPDAARDYLSRSLQSGRSFPGMEEARSALAKLAPPTAQPQT
ncbi:MAG TPA: tetratricopeptide repeat protein [Steroidobacteraceae bacterium]|jgi:tetratricopeptide (TPR) repeat protein